MHRRLVARPAWAVALLVLAGQTSLVTAGASAQRVDRDARRRATEDRAAQRTLDRAEAQLTARRPERAIGLLESSARRLPRDPRAALRVCVITIPESDETVDAVLAASPATIEAARRCDALLTLAVEEGGATLDPRVASTSAWARALLGDRAPALAQLSSRPLDERDMPALRRLAALAIADDALAEADTALSLARRVRPNDLELASELGAVRLARGDAQAAVGLFRSVVVGHPDDRDALHDLAGAYLQVGEHAQAVRLLEHLAHEEPDDARRWLELARARVELGALADAAQAARRARELAAPNDPAPSLTLGEALVLSGDVQGARSAYEDALRRDPTSLRARRALDALSAPDSGSTRK